jgi:hypothetical protein
MPARKMKFVLVNDMAPYRPTVCAACSRPLKLGYLHDLSTSKRYCGIECQPRWMVASRMIGATPFELAMTWPQLTFDIASALFDSGRRDHRD